MPFKLIDLAGQKLGKLTVVERRGKTKSGSVVWLCHCDCGSEKLLSAARLVNKLRPTKSCGCLVSEVNSARQATHRDCQSSEYRTWFSMKARCFNQNHVGYPNYGGRGITVCDKWNNSYEAFLADMGRKPSPSHSIDRIDNDGGYEPGNCRWAIKAQQGNNNRSTVKLLFSGETLSISEWARRLGMTHAMISQRLRKGWTVEQALTAPRGTQWKQLQKLLLIRSDGTGLG